MFTFSNKKTLRATVILLVGVSSLIAFFWASAPKEPEYKGQSLTELLDRYSRDREIAERSGTERWTYSAMAIRHIGAPAVPHLLEAMFYKESFPVSVQSWLNGKQSLVHFEQPEKKRQRRLVSAYALLALEDQGVAAVPVLTNAFSKDPSVLPAIALAGSREGVAYLLQMLQSTNDYARFAAVNGLGYAITNQSDVALALIKAINDPFQLVPPRAVDSLGMLHPESRDALLPTLHALTKSLSHTNWVVRQNSAMSLGRFGITARHLMPELTVATSDSVPQVRYAAARAIEEIEPGKPFVQQLFLEALRDPDRNVRYAFIVDVAYWRATNRVLLEEIKKMAANDPDSNIRATAEWALRWTETPQNRSE